MPSDAAIEAENRNENKEAAEILDSVYASMDEAYGEDIGNNNLIEWQREIEKALTLIKKFSEKHQPEIQSYK